MASSARAAMRSAGPAQGARRAGKVPQHAPYVGPALQRPSCRHSHDVTYVHVTHSPAGNGAALAQSGQVPYRANGICLGPASAAQAQALDQGIVTGLVLALHVVQQAPALADHRSEEHTSELQSLMRISYDVFSLK